MATPRPISAIRNSTIWLTPVTSVSPPTTRNVASTEIPPMSSGSRARKLANTSARMTSAPSDPIIASAMIPVPLAEDGCPLASRSRAGDPDVPAGWRGRRDGAVDRRAEVAAAEAGHRGRVDQREGGPAVAGDERRVVRGRVVRDPHVGNRPGQGGERPPGGGGGGRVGYPLPGRHGDHRQVRGLRAAVAVLAGDLVVDLERLPGHGEVVGHPVGSAADGHHADGGHDDPEKGHERLMAEYEAGERGHRSLRV